MLRPALTGGSKFGERIGQCGDTTRAFTSPEGQISGAGPTMNYPKAGAPLGQSVKSPAQPEPPTAISRSELADLLEAMQGHWPRLSIHEKTFVEWTARAVRELPEAAHLRLLVVTLHEINAHGRLLRAGTIEQLGVIQESVRHRIMRPTIGEEFMIGLWRGLWGGIVGVCTKEEMIDVGALVVHVTKWLLKTIQGVEGKNSPRKGGLTAQRWAWADADR